MGKNKISTRSKSGITLIALIITIIIMLILVGVTINVALNGGLFKKANKASLEQEKHSILERIIAMSELKDDGKIDVPETYKNVKKEFTVPQEKMNTSKTEVKFKVQGKYGIYGYKITETEINFDNSNLGSQDPVASEPGSFTFNEINDLFIEYIREEAPDTATDDEIKEMLLDILSDGMLSIQEVPGGYGTVSLLELPAGIFWEIVGKSYVGQYGVVGDGNSLEEMFALRNSDNIIITDSNEFSEYYTGSTNNSTNIFGFMDYDDYLDFFLSKAGTEFSAIVSADGKDAEGNESESIMSWDEFLEAYGDIKFTFSKAEGSQDPELKESYTVSEIFWNLTAEKEEISYIYKGETYTNILTANENYALPETIDVEIGGETAIEGTDYTWEITTDEETGKTIGKIVISNVTGSLYINASGTYNVAYITYNLSKIDYSNLVYQVTKGRPFSCTFKTDKGYSFPETIEVIMNGETLTEAMDYIWDPSTGKFETTGNVTGDIYITISAEIILPEGSEITLDADQDGEEETWIVLYNGTASHLNGNEIEVISKNTMGEDLALGATDTEAIKNATDINGNGTLEDIEIAIYSYNNAIDRINNYCESLIKIENLGVRSVGSLPSNPSYRNTSKYAIQNLDKWENKTAWNTYGVIGEGGDSNYEDDLSQMLNLIIKTGNAKSYWYASREIYEYNPSSSLNGYVNFEIKYMHPQYGDVGVTLWAVSANGKSYAFYDETYPPSMAVRPIVKLDINNLSI